MSPLPVVPQSLSASSSFSVSARHVGEFLLEAPLWLLTAVLSSKDGCWVLSHMSDRSALILLETFSFPKLTSVCLFLFQYWLLQCPVSDCKLLKIFKPVTAVLLIYEHKRADIGTFSLQPQVMTGVKWEISFFTQGLRENTILRAVLGVQRDRKVR